MALSYGGGLGLLKAPRSSGVNDAKWASPGTKKAEFKTENRKVAEFHFKIERISDLIKGSCLEWRVGMLNIIETFQFQFNNKLSHS